ncbi:MAG: UbiA family prenyltransferase [Steroidobacteraceae bacterium]
MPDTSSSRLLAGTSLARAALDALRPYQWLKNLLIFVPLAAAHRLHEPPLLHAALRAFVAFSLCSSAVYVVNDLHDLASDRLHPYKRRRPIAAGRLPRGLAITLVPLLLAASLLVVWPLGLVAAGVLAGYFLLMLAYSLGLKDIVLLDVLVLATGYAARVLLGAVAVAIVPSSWLLAFCIFFFFSLALLKRYAEISVRQVIDGAHAHARAYLVEDQSLIIALGVSSGYLAVLVLALYTSTLTAGMLYRHPAVIWLTCTLLLYWISHLWLVAHRGRMPDDPLRFILKDRLSWILVPLMGLTAWLAL